MKSYRQVREEMGAPAADQTMVPCSYCKTMTEHATASNLGSMCRACFEHYCGNAFDDEGNKARYQAGLAASRMRRG